MATLLAYIGGPPVTHAWAYKGKYMFISH